MNRILATVIWIAVAALGALGFGVIALARGESIRTEISSKYDRASVAELFDAAGLRIEAWPTDPHTPFGLVVGAPV